MKKDIVCWIGTPIGTICTALQTNQIMQYISLALTIISTSVALAFTIWKWWRKAKQDGKITEDEVDEIITDVNNIVNKDEKEKKDD